MISSARFLVLVSFALAGCGTAKKVAVASFRVVDAPARYVRDRIDPPETTTATTVQTTDVVNPGHPIAAPTPPITTPAPRVTTTTRNGSAPAGTQRPRPASAGTSPRPITSGTPRPAPVTTSFPTARPVPGRPGFVYSLDPNGGIVDVNGYKSGDKAKDPYTKQIFVVP